EFPFHVAAKTGTSQGYHDNWAIGYTREVTVGVWVGNFDRRPLVGSSGVSGAGPIFHDVMMAAEERVTGGALPPDVQPATTATPKDAARRAICALSGWLATPWCPTQLDEWVPADGAEKSCDWHHNTAAGITVEWPETFQAWARSQPSLKSAPAPAKVPTLLRIVSPPDGAVYLIDPTLRKEFQTVPLRASSLEAAIEWRVDGNPVPPTSRPDIEWALSPGRHQIAANDRFGHQAVSAIEVR